MEDPDTGLQTVLTRMAPGAVLTDHMHVEIEQTWVLEGSLVDHEGEARAGTFVWRPAGSRHVARAPNGALLLGIFQKPNKFF
jgi:anti-sigma factor ChrR (cupin superfamily)